jgi:hypothetical protein
MQSPLLLALAVLWSSHLLTHHGWPGIRPSDGNRCGPRAVALRSLWIGALGIPWVALLDFDLWQGVSVCALAIPFHALLEGLRAGIDRRFEQRLSVLLCFELLQGALAAIGAALWMDLARRSPLEWPEPPSSPGLALDGAEILRLCVWTGAFACAIGLGSEVVARVLADLRRENAAGERSDAPASAPPDRSGRRIGVLERLILVAMVALGQWGAIGFILTAKSIARFRELEDRRFAETYLVGTLTSFLVAAVLGGAVVLLLPA